PMDTLEMTRTAGDQRFTQGLMADFPELGGGNKRDFILQTRATSDLGGANNQVFFGFYALSSAQAYDDVRNGGSGYAAFYGRNASGSGIDLEVRENGHFGTLIDGENFNATANIW